MLKRVKYKLIMITHDLWIIPFVDISQRRYLVH